MFVITADQVASRRHPDRVETALALLADRWGAQLELPPERTAGDELQALTADADAALGIVLELGRDGAWSTGLGVGPVELPLGSSTRASTGPVYVAAREAVEAARRSADPRFAARRMSGRAPETLESEPLIALLLLLRSRRSAAGWAVAELLDAGSTQAEAAARLGVSPQAVSQRALAAGLRVDEAAVPVLARLLASEDERAGSAA